MSSAEHELSTNGPWGVVSRREAYRNPWFSVREDQVIRPDGNPGLYAVIHFPGAVGVVAVTEEGQAYLVGQYRYPTEQYSWEVPEGYVEPGEDPLQAAQRELREEAGLLADRWVSLGDAYLSNSSSDQVMHFFLAQGLFEVEMAPDPTEELAVRAMPMAELLDMARTSAITDAPSVIAIFRAWHHLQQ